MGTARLEGGGVRADAAVIHGARLRALQIRQARQLTRDDTARLLCGPPGASVATAMGDRR